MDSFQTEVKISRLFPIDIKGILKISPEGHQDLFDSILLLIFNTRCLAASASFRWTPFKRKPRYQDDFLVI